MLEAQQLRAAFAGDLELVGRNELRRALHLRTLRCFAMPARPLVSWPTTLSLYLRNVSSVDLRRAEVDAEVVRVRGFVDHRGRMQQRLRRNAADVEAHAAECGVALDQHRVQAEVGGAERGGVAAGTGAEHDDVAFDVGLAAGGGSGRGPRDGVAGDGVTGVACAGAAGCAGLRRFRFRRRCRFAGASAFAGASLAPSLSMIATTLPSDNLSPTLTFNSMTCRPPTTALPSSPCPIPA